MDGINQYFTDLAAASGSATNADAVATQYNDASGNVAAYKSAFGGTIQDGDPLPANACPVTAGQSCINLQDVESELNTFLTVHGMPRDLTHEYFLLTPPDVVVCLDASDCSGNAGTHADICGFHSQTSTGYTYAVIADLTGITGCDLFMTHSTYFCPVTSCLYDNGPADGVLSTISHEHNESTTDPQPNTGWTDWGTSCGSTSDVCGGETGDQCANDAFLDPGLRLQPDGSGNATPYNQTINGHHYLLQREWSNQGHTCLDGFTPGGTTVDAGFADSINNTTVTFDAHNSAASTGVAEYVWQFNDGSSLLPQAATTETPFPAISHVFSPGTHQVALTVMATDGTSTGATATFVVGNGSSPGIPSPVALFSASPSTPAVGVQVHFDAGGSTAATGGSLVSYRWSFGDGTTATGNSAAHTFTTAGDYMVTLTLGDNRGLQSSLSRTVMIALHTAPVSAFNAPSGPEGYALTFDGRPSSDPNGGGHLVSYRWLFDDGTAATGALARHAFRKGTHLVILTAADNFGLTSYVQHLVTVSGPVAAFKTPLRPLTAKSLTFTALQPGPAPAGFSFRWRFGDGKKAHGTHVHHKFKKPGRYHVTLTVIDSSGNRARITHVVVVRRKKR